MSLEDAIVKLTAAVEANTAAQKAGGNKPASTGGGSSGYKAKHSKQEMMEKLTEFKAVMNGDTTEPLKIIKEVGKADSMKNIDDAETIDKVYDATIAAIEKAKAAGSDGM